jgi:hypothetical protein
MAEIKKSLNYRTWDPVFEGDDVNTIFNSFLNTYLRIFYSSFPLIKINEEIHNNSWIMIDIKTSYKRKRELYLASRNSNNSIFKKLQNLQ